MLNHGDKAMQLCKWLDVTCKDENFYSPTDGYLRPFGESISTQIWKATVVKCDNDGDFAL